nr:UDP-3-O-(3-hydroxymyristoyl)glucosamine N-acyltransferase [Kribbella sandramycini]
MAELLEVSVGSAPEYVVRHPVPADSDDPDGLTFAGDAKYLRIVEAHGAGAVIVPTGTTTDRPHLVAADPRLAFETFLAMCRRPLRAPAGVHPAAIVAPDADIHPTASIGPYVVIEPGVRIGAGAKLLAHVYIGADCVVGPGTVIHPHVTLYPDVVVGARCILHAGAVIGADGFGFRWDGQVQRKVEQVGRVVIGDDVEIGAGTAIDRATAGATVIGDGVKLDNQVQIGHNARIGAQTVICGQSAVGGSAVLGERVTMGGQSGVGDHVQIAAGATLAANTSTVRDLPTAQVYYGTPARPLAEGLRIAARLPRLVRDA